MITYRYMVYKSEYTDLSVHIELLTYEIFIELLQLLLF